jgi:flagella basal body P-ring formation protein FlgA
MTVFQRPAIMQLITQLRTQLCMQLSMPLRARVLSTVLLTAMFLTQVASAQAPTRQDTAAIQREVQDFLQIQSAGLPGEATITVGAIDTRLNLDACPAPQAFLPTGSRAWGKTTVGVRCQGPAIWTIYVQASVRVMGTYIASAVPLARGQAIEQSQLIALQGDMTTLPAGVATDMTQVIGRMTNVSLPSGMPLRIDTLRSKPVVLQGQVVRLVSSGAGFSVSAEARAMSNASEGQIVQSRTPTGQVISGTARADGVIEVLF